MSVNPRSSATLGVPTAAGVPPLVTGSRPSMRRSLTPVDGSRTLHHHSSLFSPLTSHVPAYMQQAALMSVVATPTLPPPRPYEPALCEPPALDIRSLEAHIRLTLMALDKARSRFAIQFCTLSCIGLACLTHIVYSSYLDRSLVPDVSLHATFLSGSSVSSVLLLGCVVVLLLYVATGTWVDRLHARPRYVHSCNRWLSLFGVQWKEEGVEEGEAQRTEGGVKDAWRRLWITPKEGLVIEELPRVPSPSHPTSTQSLRLRSSQRAAFNSSNTVSLPSTSATPKVSTPAPITLSSLFAPPPPTATPQSSPVASSISRAAPTSSKPATLASAASTPVAPTPAPSPAVEEAGSIPTSVQPVPSATSPPPAAVLPTSPGDNLSDAQFMQQHHARADASPVALAVPAAICVDTSPPHSRTNSDTILTTPVAEKSATVLNLPALDVKNLTPSPPHALPLAAPSSRSRALSPALSPHHLAPSAVPSSLTSADIANITTRLTRSHSNPVLAEAQSAIRSIMGSSGRPPVAGVATPLRRMQQRGAASALSSPRFFAGGGRPPLPSPSANAAAIAALASGHRSGSSTPSSTVARTLTPTDARFLRSSIFSPDLSPEEDDLMIRAGLAPGPGRGMGVGVVSAIASPVGRSRASSAAGLRGRAGSFHVLSSALSPARSDHSSSSVGASELASATHAAAAAAQEQFPPPKDERERVMQQMQRLEAAREAAAAAAEEEVAEEEADSQGEAGEMSTCDSEDDSPLPEGEEEAEAPRVSMSSVQSS